MVNCTLASHKFACGPSAKPPHGRGTSLETNEVDREYSKCLFPVHRGSSVTTEFGRLTGFLTLRDSYFKHPAISPREERKATRKRLPPTPVAAVTGDGSSRRHLNRTVLIQAVLSATEPQGRVTGRPRPCPAWRGPALSPFLPVWLPECPCS